MPEELVSVYRRQVVPLAQLVTPNQFELELLTGCTVTSVANAFEACDGLHKEGVRAVVRFHPKQPRRRVRRHTHACSSTSSPREVVGNLYPFLQLDVFPY